MSHQRITTRSQNLIGCRSCGHVSRVPEGAMDAAFKCPVCNAHLESRESGMISKTWALVMAGLILYIPANLFPIMTLDMLGNSEKETIFSGVVELFQSGMYAIGLLVFCASITVPLMKLLGLAYLLLTVQRRHTIRKRDRTRLYRVIEFIGRWSMLDVFLLSILVAVVSLGQVATISPEIGMVFFASVVIITMFAAHIFDPRLIWDRAETNTQPT